MIDLVYKVSPEHWGVIEEVTEDYITIFRNEWAPGLWAGVNNVEVAIKQAGGSFYKSAIYVTHCDLEERKLFFKCNPDKLNIEAGDTIHIMEKINGR